MTNELKKLYIHKIFISSPNYYEYFLIFKKYLNICYRIDLCKSIKTSSVGEFYLC